MTLHHGDCLEVMPTLPPESIDAVVTDPPYGLEFMGKEWDKLGAVTLTDPSVVGGFQDGNGGNPFSRSRVRFGRDARSMQQWHEAWARAAFRVAKPGAYLLAFGGTRTVHRLACAIEDAGWIIRDMLVWAYASGFPKSHNLDGDWQGWGTALKPAWEPIILARKPLRGTVAANVQRYGTGALNIDGCRIGTSKDVPSGRPSRARASEYGMHEPGLDSDGRNANIGRWPANLILTDPIFDGDTPGVVGGGEARSTNAEQWAADGRYQRETPFGPAGFGLTYGDSGTYSRFFLIPKASRSDREPVLGGLPERERTGDSAMARRCRQCGERFVDPLTQMPRCGHDEREWVTGKPRRNHHPTVKPLDLMRHFVRLVTPPGGTVLDPFLGSGTTALACELEGFGWVGIEKEAEYVAIAEARLNGTQRGIGL